MENRGSIPLAETHFFTAFPLYLFSNFSRPDPHWSTPTLGWWWEASSANIRTSAVSPENREGWPLLTVETEANGDLWSTNQRGPSLVCSLGSPCRYKRFSSCLGSSSQPGTQYFFPHLTLINFMCPHVVPIAQQPWQAVVPGRLSLSMCLWM